MARNMVEHKVDDLSGQEDETIEEVRFLGNDGNVYRIDLGKENRDEHDERVSALQDKATLVGTIASIREPGKREPVQVGGRAPARAKPAAPKAASNGHAAAKPASTPSASRMDRQEASDMRNWARSNGWPELKDRGRVPDEVREAYENRAQ